jgi:3-hydroxyacyl-[acyl-carrier-protein] dehydratase
MITQEIKQRLPHRWPFLFVDRVTKIAGQTIEGYKNVSTSDIVFLGHFPEVSILPGVVIVESLAQLSGILLSERAATAADAATAGAADTTTADTTTTTADSKIGFLTSIRNFKFIKTVVPGDQLFLKSLLKGSSGECYLFAVSAYVDKKEVANGEIQLFLQNREMVV